jgi:hypothetical protein
MVETSPAGLDNSPFVSVGSNESMKASAQLLLPTCVLDQYYLQNIFVNIIASIFFN